MLDLRFSASTEKSLEKYVKIAQLDYIPEYLVILIYQKIFRLVFNEKNSAIDNENFNKLGQESSNFLVMTGSITIFISFYFSIAMINEVVIGLICIKLYRHFSTPLPLQKSLEASNQD